MPSGHSATTPTRTSRPIIAARWIKAGGGQGRRQVCITAKKDAVSNRVRGRKESRGGRIRTQWKDSGGKHKERSILCNCWGTATSQSRQGKIGKWSADTSSK